MKNETAKADTLWHQRHLKRFESEVQPLIEQGKYWAALSVAAPIWAALAPGHSKTQWYLDLKSKAFQSLTERAQGWKDIPGQKVHRDRRTRTQEDLQRLDHYLLQNEASRVLTRKLSVLMDVQVPVERTREIERLKRILHATAKVQVTVAQGVLTQTITRELEEIAGRFDPGQAPQAAPQGLFASQDSTLGKTLIEAEKQLARSMTIAHHSQQLRLRAEELQSSGNLREATEVCAIASVASAEDGGACRELLAAQLELPLDTFTPYQPKNLGAISSEAALQPEPFRAIGSTQIVLNKGYPAIAIFVGAQMQRAPEIVGQPRRTGLSVAIQTEMDLYGVAVEEPYGWAGFVPMTFRLFLGPRVSEAYEFPAAVTSTTEEGSWNAGIDMSLGALFGHRSRKLGIFGGVLPGYQGQLLGAFRQSGSSIPVAARIELRLRERYPLIASAWGFDLSDEDQYSRGASLLVPYRTGFWLTAWVRQTQASSETEGLRSEDIVDLGNRVLTTFSLGLTFSQ